jgi:hypothetical protein
MSRVVAEWDIVGKRYFKCVLNDHAKDLKVTEGTKLGRLL